MNLSFFKCFLSLLKKWDILNIHRTCIMSTLILISWSTWHLKRTLNIFSRIESDIKYHFKDTEVYSSYKMILCFFITALATVIECGVINTIDQGMLHSLMLHNFCYFKDKFFQLCIFFHEQISLPQQLLSSQEDESNTQILKNLTFDYRIVASTSPSRFEAHAGLFRLLMKVIFDAYVLWPFSKKIIFLN